MKVLVISAAFPPMHAGEATNAMYLCQHLADRKLDVHVLTSQPNSGINDPRLTIHPIMRNWSWSEVPRFRSFLKRCSPDAVYLMYLGLMYHYHPMITYAATISKRIYPHVPFITRYESVFESAEPGTTSLLSRAFRKWVVVNWAGTQEVVYNSGTLLRDSDRVIVMCGLHRAVMLQELPSVASKTVLIPPPPNIHMCTDEVAARHRGRQMLGVKPDDFVIAFMGYVYPKKGVETLLRAFQAVCRQRHNVRLLIIGGKIGLAVPDRSSYVERMSQLSKELEVDEKITWTGEFKWDAEDASLYLNAADACVLPFNEGVHFNNSSFSAVAAHGLPIITTRGLELDQPIIHNENVLLCPPKDVEALAEAITRLLDNPDLCKHLRAGAKALAREWLSWNRAIDRTVDTLCVKPPGKPTHVSGTK